jgi:hypothetical protein
MAIHGCDTIIFSGRNGEYKALDVVYYIPRLRNSIILFGQLDKIGSKIYIKDGVLRIHGRESWLLARVPCCGLYMLRLEVARPVCLTARRGDDAWRWHDQFGYVNFGALWGGAAWCAGCCSWLTLSRCVTSASPPSTGAPPSPSR